MDRVKSTCHWTFNELGKVCWLHPSLTKIFFGTVATVTGVRASLSGWRRKKRVTLAVGMSLSVVGVLSVVNGVTEVLFPQSTMYHHRSGSGEIFGQPPTNSSHPMCHLWPDPGKPRCDLWSESKRALGQLPTEEEAQRCIQQLNTIPDFSESTYGKIVDALGGIPRFCAFPMYPVDKVMVGMTGYLDQFKHEDLGLWPIWRGVDGYGRPFVALRMWPLQTVPGCGWIQTMALFQRYTDWNNNWVGGGHEPLNKPLYLYSSGGITADHIARLSNLTQNKPIRPFGRRGPVCLLTFQ